jgi:hypothetical protein
MPLFSSSLRIHNPYGLPSFPHSYALRIHTNIHTHAHIIIITIIIILLSYYQIIIIIILISIIIIIILKPITSIKSQLFWGPLWKTKVSLGVPALMRRRHLRLERSDASAGISNRFSPKELGNSAAERRSSATHFWWWGLSSYPLVI